MRNISVKQYLFGTVVQEEKLYKVISYLELWARNYNAHLELRKT